MFIHTNQKHLRSKIITVFVVKIQSNQNVFNVQLKLNIDQGRNLYSVHIIHLYIYSMVILQKDIPSVFFLSGHR